MALRNFKGLAGFEGLAVLGLLVILFTGCPLIDYFTFEGTPVPVPHPEPNTSSPQPPVAPPAENVTPANPQADALWAQITNAQAESGCLRQAKKVAVDSGYPETFVFSCTCRAQESDATKSYECNVATADPFGPNKPVRIFCVKSQNQCAVNAEGTTYMYTFSELEAFARG